MLCCAMLSAYVTFVLSYAVPCRAAPRRARHATSRYRWLRNRHSSRRRWRVRWPDPAPLIWPQVSYKAGTSWCTTFECVWVSVCVCVSDRQGLTMVSRSWACDLSVLFAQFNMSFYFTDTFGSRFSSGDCSWTSARRQKQSPDWKTVKSHHITW